MNISEIIESAESKHKERLETYLEELFSGINLDSHGPEHHARVWANARRIISSPLFAFTGPAHRFTEDLIIACYLHDSGMVVDKGARHGRISSDHCIRYLALSGLNPANYAELTDAIEKHDNKDYTGQPDGSLLKNILSVADDIDAFGITGIYRYFEIYLERGISKKSIGSEILKNATGRFNNLKTVLWQLPEIVGEQEVRFEMLKQFCTGYNNQVDTYSFKDGNPSGYCGIAELLEEMLSYKKGIRQLIEEIESSRIDIFIRDFFRTLNTELDGK
ncbi:MAG: hypothetical protein U0X39_13140 [Bacteroidales bacterium]